MLSPIGEVAGVDYLGRFHSPQIFWGLILDSRYKNLAKLIQGESWINKHSSSVTYTVNEDQYLGRPSAPSGTAQHSSQEYGRKPFADFILHLRKSCQYTQVYTLWDQKAWDCRWQFGDRRDEDWHLKNLLIRSIAVIRN